MCWLFILNISALHVILNSNIEVFPANDTKLKKRKPPLKTSGRFSESMVSNAMSTTAEGDVTVYLT